MKEDLKRRIWTVALISLVSILILPVFCALELERNNPVYIFTKSDVVRLIGITNPMFGIFTIIAAVVIALSGFYYLQSRKKVDLYHSIPVRRETLFSINYINGVLVYAIPYIINIIICFLILSTKKLFHTYDLTAAFAAFGINLLYFCLIYSITIIAVMMTGNIIVSALGTAVFLFYGPMWMELQGLYCNNFFKTYYDNYNNLSSFQFTSPIFAYLGTAMAYKNNENYIAMTIVAMIAMIALTGLAVFLYKKRPSEAAGKSMTFEVTKPVIEILLVIPISLGAGVLLHGVVNANKDGWFLFGLLFALIVVHAFIQVIYNFDIRCAIKQKKQLFACTVITGLIACVFRFDLINFNTYIPKMDDIAYMSVSISGIDQNLHNYNDNTDRYLDEEDYELDNMKLTKFNFAYELAQRGINSIDNIDSDFRNYYIKQGYYKYVVKYTLKNKRVIYRQYCLPIEDSSNTLKNIYENKEYKEGHFPINKVNVMKIDEIDVSYASEILNYTAGTSNGNGNVYISAKTNRKDISTFMSIYKEELNKLTYDSAMKCPIAKVSFSISGNAIYYYYIYPSFVKTLAFIQKHGFDAEKSIDLDQITKIEINNENYEEEDNKTVDSSQNQSVSYTDKKTISNLYPLLTDGDIYQNSPTLMDTDNLTEVHVSYKTEDNNVQDFLFYIGQSRIPDYVKDDLKMKK